MGHREKISQYGAFNTAYRRELKNNLQKKGCLTLQKTREATVLAHIDAENRKAIAEVARTFHHPRYEVIPTGETHDGSEQVASFLEESMAAFPDFTFEMHALRHASDAVIVEVTFRGTHLGNWKGLPATGRKVAYRMCNVFLFDQDRLICERLYFDLLTILRQLGIGRDPTSLLGRAAILLNHPLTFLKASLRRALENKTKK